MELGTAGSILSYGIELEVKALEFYLRILTDDVSPHARVVLEAIHKQHRKMSRKLDRMRKENVTEMILEPIYGFQSHDYILDLTSPVEGNNILTTAKQIEELIQDFCNNAAMKVAFLPDLSQLLVDLGRMSRRNLDSLAELG
ncbi:MAG: hypothetical protein ACFFEA_10630 [Candidatus Thorarchaeota archaeon]